MKASIFNVGVSPSSICITPNAKYAYTTNSNNYQIPGQDSVTVLDLKKGVPKMTIFDSSFNQPYRMAIDNCGKYGYVANSGGQTLSIINIRKNKVCSTISGFDGPGSIALSKYEGFVSNYGATPGVGSGNGNTISVFSQKDWKITSTITVEQAPAAVLLSRCQRLLFVICYVSGLPGTGTLNVIDTKQNQVISKLSGFFGPFDLALNPSGSKLYITNFGSNNFSPFGTTVSVVNLKCNKIVDEIDIGIQPSGICIDENHVYTCAYNSLYASPQTFENLTYGEGSLNIVRLKDHKLIKSIGVGSTPSTITIGPDKKLYICCYSQNVVRALYYEIQK